MPYTTMPIVGAFFRPPAKTLLDALAVGTPLTLKAEPTNNFDPNAIAVWLRSADIPEASHDFLEANLPASGHSIEDIMAQEYWHLGYIPKEMAAELKAHYVVLDGQDLPVTFAVNPKGAARIKFPEPVL
jgi:hypothetical protein